MLKSPPPRKESIKIIGYSVGDDSVGIGRCDFEVDTGLLELDADDKDFLINTVVRALYELHDNGHVIFDFSDEVRPSDFCLKRIYRGD